MSARAELEAAIWRSLTKYKDITRPASSARADTAFTVAVAAAADRYAQDEYGRGAERRAELANAISVAVHWQHPHRSDREAACSAAKTATTSVRSAVTCPRCMRSRVWKETTS